MALDAWRQELGLNHREFAARIGVHETNWCLIRKGKRPAPARLWLRVIQINPGLAVHLAAEVGDVAREEAPTRTLSVA